MILTLKNEEVPRMAKIKKTIEVKYTSVFHFLYEWMPKLNATSELFKIGKHYEKNRHSRACSSRSARGLGFEPR